MENYLSGELYKLKSNAEKEFTSLSGISAEKLRKGLLVHDSYNIVINGQNEIYYSCSYPEKIELPKSVIDKYFTKQ